MDREKHRKKSIYLIYEFLSEQGGLERELIIHANFLKEEGYDVKILTCHLDKKILTLLPFQGIKVETISLIKTPFEWINMALCFLGLNKLGRYNPDTFISYSFPCSYLIKNKKTKKINYVNHYPHFLYLTGKEKIEWAVGTQGVKRRVAVIVSWLLGSYLRKTDRKLIRKNNLVFMNSQFTKKRLEKLYGLKNTIVSYPPLDRRFDTPGKENIKERFVFSSSRIIPDKKYELLIEAMSFTKKKIPLWLAGSVENSYKKSLEELARKKKVSLRFLGKLTTEQIKDYYSSAEVFAFPTPGEDFGLVPAESLACGTPVIVWGDGAGPTEQVIDGINGYHAKPYDLKDFARKIDLAIEKSLKRKNRKKILESAKKFSYQEVKKGFMKEVNKVLSRP